MSGKVWEGRGLFLKSGVIASLAEVKGSQKSQERRGWFLCSTKFKEVGKEVFKFPDLKKAAKKP